jgi:hypothetical protein
MIRVTVELVSAVDPKRNRVLGRLEIANDGTGTKDLGSYRGTLHAEYTGPGGRAGRVEGHARSRKSVWTLVGAFLKQWGHTPGKATIPAPEVQCQLQIDLAESPQSGNRQ